MTALASERATQRREPHFNYDPVAASVLIFAGALVCLDASGNATPGATAAGLTARGIADATVDNSSGAAGDVSVTTRKGMVKLANAGDIDRTSIGSTAYIVDDQTVSLDNTGKSAAGRIDQVDADGVWVEIV